MEAFGVRTARERDLVTCVVTVAGLGVAALLIYLTVTTTSARGATITVMFGSMFSIPEAIVPLALAVGLGALALAAMLYRPLLLSSVDADLARAQGIPTRLVGLAFLALLGLAVALSALTVGAILSTALLIGPAATALRLADRPGRALLLAPLIGLAATYIGILIAYDSYGWTGGHGWPVSFCIVTLIFLAYLATGLPRRAGKPLPTIDVEV
jgi:zinc/manganese transport system permease protein